MNARHAWATVGTVLALVALYLIVTHSAPVTNLAADAINGADNTLLILQGRGAA